MRTTFLFVTISLLFTSCFLFRSYNSTNFIYSGASGVQSLPIVIPKGYQKFTSNTDAAGNTDMIWEYPGGKVLYIAHLKDTTKSYQPILHYQHQPREHPLGGLIYKGVGLDLLYWREIRRDNFRFGYMNVSSHFEKYFDSSTNQMSLLDLK